MYFFTPELRMSQSSWRPWSLQLTLMWYNRHTKTSVSPDNSIKDVAHATHVLTANNSKITIAMDFKLQGSISPIHILKILTGDMSLFTL